MIRSKFTWQVKERVILIEDIGTLEDESVTNDMEEVLDDIRCSLGLSPRQLCDRTILAKDSFGDWDLVETFFENYSDSDMDLLKVRWDKVPTSLLHLTY